MVNPGRGKGARPPLFDTITFFCHFISNRPGSPLTDEQKRNLLIGHGLSDSDSTDLVSGDLDVISWTEPAVQMGPVS